MKSVLPLLLCYVLTTAQTFALSGGPVFGSGAVSTTGTYSGVILGLEETDSTSSGPAIPGDPLPPSDTPNSVPSNALGLFSMNVPASNLATGTFMLFADGTIFTGTIDASVDPDSGQMKGLLQGSYNFNLTVFTGTGSTTTAVTAQANGKIDARVTARGTTSGTSLARLNGTSALEVNFGEVDTNTLQPIVVRTITFLVSGYKQTVV